jgi:hypothetical protein
MYEIKITEDFLKELTDTGGHFNTDGHDVKRCAYCWLQKTDPPPDSFGEQHFVTQTKAIDLTREFLQDFNDLKLHVNKCYSEEAVKNNYSPPILLRPNQLAKVLSFDTDMKSLRFTARSPMDKRACGIIYDSTWGSHMILISAYPFT